MPVTTRRRPPLRRSTSGSSSSSSPSSSRRNVDTKVLVNANAFGNLEVGGIVRAVLLGALVGGLVIFLFYPDISSLMEQWQNVSEQSGLLHPTASEKDGIRDSSTRPRSASSNKAKQNVHSKPVTKKSATAKKASKPPAANKHRESRENSQSFCPCQCQRPVTPPRCQPPPSKAQTKPKEEIPVEDLMEEEVAEEEDSVEVELMEEEDLAQFIELDPEEDTTSRSSPPSDVKSDSINLAADEAEPRIPKDSPSNTDNGGEERMTSAEDSHTDIHIDDGELGSKDIHPDNPSQAVLEEPLVLTDGQPITFTPLSPGDENVIRVGGRPKPGKEASTQTAAKPSTNTHDTSKQNTSAKPSASNQSPRQAGTNAATSPKRSQTKQKSDPKKNASKAGGEDKDSRENADLPEEVKNFQPAFLKTVTAKKIFADGRRIPPVELLPQKETNSSVRVFLFNEFLSEAECNGLRRVHDKHVQDMSAKPLLCFDSLNTLRKHLRDAKHNVPVTPNDFVAGTKCLNASFSRQLGGWMHSNWSYSTAFYPGESRFSTIFAARVQQAMGMEPRNGGKFQITSYPTGKAYKAHTDCVLEGGDPRDRVATVLVYLDDVEDGGETKFPELGIWVKPRKGRALVWNNMSPEGVCEPHSLHVASKVNSGSKYILIRWYYYKSFYSLGKRPPEPSLPPRTPGTPRVSCDDYDNGSCRWYDEWNNDHLVDYEYQKYTLI